MEYNTLVQLVGTDWADFLKPFMCPDDSGKCRYDEIGSFLRTQYEGGKKVYPENRKLIFRPFVETPLKDVRVIIIGTEPYCRPGYDNGLPFATDNEKLPMSLQQVYRAIEKDVYNHLDFTNPSRTGILGKPLDNGYKTWMSQGVLLLNCALTGEEKVKGAHLELWRPFIEFIVSNLWRIKRDLIFIAIGPHAKEVMNYRGGNLDGDIGTGVHIFHAFPLQAEHPVDAINAKRDWSTDVFSRTNLIIKCNGLGSPVEW